MIGFGEINIVPKEELDLQSLANNVLSLLTDPAFTYSQSGLTYLGRVSGELGDRKELKVPRSIVGFHPRRKEDLEKFIAMTAYFIQRDLVRIIALYDWATKMDAKLESVSSSSTTIKRDTEDLLKKILSSNSNKSIANMRVVTTNMREPGEVVTGTSTYVTGSGSVTTNMTLQIVEEAIVSIEAMRDVYLENPYEKVADSQKEVEEGQRYYDASEDALQVAVDVKGTDIATIRIEAEQEFSIEKVEDLSGRAPTDITERCIGRDISYNGVVVIDKTPTSKRDDRGIETYEVLIPDKGVSDVRVTLSFASSDTQLVDVVDVINSSGEVVYRMSPTESFMYRRVIPGDKDTLDRLNKLVEGNSTRSSLVSYPIRELLIHKVSVYRETAAVEGIAVLNEVNSTGKILSMELLVDAYDTDGLVEYELMYGDNKENIVPSNLGGKVKVFSGTLPTVLGLNVRIPDSDVYRPVVHGISMILKEES